MARFANRSAREAASISTAGFHSSSCTAGRMIRQALRAGSQSTPRLTSYGTKRMTIAALSALEAVATRLRDEQGCLLVVSLADRTEIESDADPLSCHR